MAASAFQCLFIACRRILRDAALVLLETAAAESDPMVLLLYPSCDSDGGGVLSARSSIRGVWRVRMMCGDRMSRLVPCHVGGGPKRWHVAVGSPSSCNCCCCFSFSAAAAFRFCALMHWVYVILAQLYSLAASLLRYSSRCLMRAVSVCEFFWHCASAGSLWSAWCCTALLWIVYVAGHRTGLHSSSICPPVYWWSFKHVWHSR